MASINAGPSRPGLHLLAVPAVCLLILFLGYSSQWLFAASATLEPGPPTARQTCVFNALLLALWWTYYKACTVSPGRYVFPPASASASDPAPTTSKPFSSPEPPLFPPPKPEHRQQQPARWCKKCRAPKPPRAHHCRHCRACIPKMDHHCPWTANCVSLASFPYFLRFLAYANVSLWYLFAALLRPRLLAVWRARRLPAYLGPSPPALVHLALLSLVCAAVSLALGVLLFTTARGWALNTTMIEAWEIERHEALVRRHRQRGSWWNDGEEDDGDAAAAALRLDQIEFPYDVGFWRNMCQAMGSANPLAWLWPFAGGPVVSADGQGTGWAWEENGFNEREGMWPPPDPEKARRACAGGWPGAAAARRQQQQQQQQRGLIAGEEEEEDEWADSERAKAAFRARQERDLQRWRGRRQGGIVAELEETDGYDYGGGVYDEEEEEEEEEEEGADGYDENDYEEGMDGEPGWTNSDGDRLRDYGVDEEADEDVEPQPQPQAPGQDDDDDVPLGELIRRRKIPQREEEACSDGGG